MNDRKQHVIKIAHQLFIEKGFQATSIQDILQYSGISKGTFYNYFSSKNELLIALFKMIYAKLDEERKELLIGQDPANIEIFIKQIELQMQTNKANKLLSLFEEVFFSKDEDLKDFIKEGQLKMIRWTYKRFIDLFGVSKQPYLLDCTIMFMGILNHNLKFNALTIESKASIYEVVRYSVERIVKIVEEVAETKEQLLKPELLDQWLPENNLCNREFHKNLSQTISSLINVVSQIESQSKYMELLDFIQEELLYSKNSRTFLVESALLSLKTDPVISGCKELHELEQLVTEYFKQIEKP